MTNEDDVRRTLHAKADGLEVDDRAFDPDLGTVVELDDAIGRRSRRTVWTAVVAAAVIIAVVAVALAVRSPETKPAKVGETPSTIPETTTTLGMLSRSQPAPEALVQQVTSVPPGVVPWPFGDHADDWLEPFAGPVSPRADGKVSVRWVGAEYCPYCAAERWPLVIALARFGTFSGLRVTSSAAETTVGSPEVFPSTQSFSFHGASYESKYIDFEAAETQDNKYQPLDQLSAAQSAVFEKYDAPPYVAGSSQGAIPFVVIGGDWLISGASYDAGILQEKNVQQIADALRDPASDIAKNIDHVADAITARLCGMIGQNRTQVPECSDPAIVAPIGGTGVPG